MRQLSDFQGVWLFRRQIEHASGEVMTVTGRASFDPDGTGLTCREEGTMLLPSGQQLAATRVYHWRDGLDVYFDDGRFFHTIPPEGGTAEHWCDPDMYRVKYRFGPEAWQADWTVRGPAKDYVMRTVYARTQDGLNTSAFRQ